MGSVPATAGSSCRWPASTSSSAWLASSDIPSGSPTTASPLRTAGSTVSRTSSAGPCAKPEELVADPHVTARHMLVGIRRTDGVDQPVLVPGNPTVIVGRGDGAARPIPWRGEHTDEVLREELGLTDAAIESLRSSSVVG